MKHILFTLFLFCGLLANAQVNCPQPMITVANTTICNGATTVAVGACRYSIATGTMSGNNVVPAVATSGTGSYTATLDLTNRQLVLTGNFSQMSGTISGAAIHTGAAGANGAVAVDLVPLGFPTGVISGTFNVTTTLTIAQATSFQNSGLHLLLKTPFRPNGEIRGQFAPPACSIVSYQWSNGAISPTTQLGVGTQGLTVTDGGGCTTSASVNITSFPINQVSVTGNLGVCPGATTQLNASQQLNYLWSNGATTSSITVGAGTFTVSGTDGNGCTTSATATVVQNTNPIPTITQNGAVIGTGNFVSYQWNLNVSPIAGATSQTYTPTQNGNYTVVVTDANGCTGTSGPFLVNFVGIQIPNRDIRLFPNPASAAVQLDGLMPEDVLTLFNALGQPVWSRIAYGNTEIIARQGLPSGVYTLQISNAEGSGTFRLIFE